jgi:DNA-binding NarL/FixJ family response regulator
MDHSYKIAILDDHTLILNGFKLIFSEHKNIIIHSFTQPSEMKTFLEKEPIDLLVTDLSMPDISGLDFIRWFKNRYPEAKTALYTQVVNQKVFEDSLLLGINGYILKTDDVLELPNIILKLLEGETYLSSELSKFKRTNKEFPKMQPLEIEILNHIINGKSTRETSQILDLTEKVIEYRMRKLRKQFDCKNNMELIYKVKENYI